MQIKFLTAKDISEIMGCSISKAYKIIQQLNGDLLQKGFKVDNGRVNEEQFAKAYGFTTEVKQIENING